MFTDEMEKYRNKDRQEEAGICIMGEMRKDREEINWEEKYNKEHKLRQEAQEALANALEVNESHQKMNGKLQERVTELEEERLAGLRKSGL